MSLSAKKYLAYAAICIIWGTSWAAVKLGLETVPPLCSVGLRFSLATALLGVAVARKKIATPKQRSFWVLAGIMCATSFTVPFGLIYWAQQRIDSGIAAILFATFPLWVALLSGFFLPEEKMTPARWLGIILGFTGIAVIFRGSFQNLDSYPDSAMAAVLIGAAIQAFGLIALRKMGSAFNPVILNFWSLMLSAIAVMSFSFIGEDYSTLNLGGKAMLSIIYLAAFSTVLTFVVYFWLAARVEAVVLSFTAFITTVLAVLTGVFLMAETMTADVLFGSIIVLAGIVWANWNAIVGRIGQARAQRGKKSFISRHDEKYETPADAQE
jgi:drug/metabolite transporter (DMT)-like permease